MRDTRHWDSLAFDKFSQAPTLYIMKLLIQTVFLVSTLFGCTSPSPPDKSHDIVNQQDSNNKLEETALSQVFSKIRNLPNAKLTGKQIAIGDSTITLKTTTEFNGQKAGNWFYAASFSTLYNFGQAENITIGSIGIGTSANEAQEVCIQEWSATFGTAFTNMLQDSSGIVLSNIKIFPGLLGIRGNLPANTWLKGDDTMTKKIISKISSGIHPKTNGITAIDIHIMINSKGVIDGECRLNSQISKILLDSLKLLDWPSSEKGFLFKQFYLIKKINK